MFQLSEEFYNIHHQMSQASKWKEAITGEPYDLKVLKKMASKIDIRQELWLYVEVSTHTIKEWNRILFKKVCIPTRAIADNATAMLISAEISITEVWDKKRENLVLEAFQ